MSKKNQRPAELPVETTVPEMPSPTAESEAPAKAKKSIFNIIIVALAAILGVVALFLPYGVAEANAISSLSAADVLGYGVYVLLVGVVVTVVLAVAAIIVDKKSNCFTRWATLACAAGLASLTIFSSLELGSMDMIPVALTVVATVLYFVVTVKYLGKQTLWNIIHLVFAWAFIALFVIGTGENGKTVAAGDSSMLFLVAIILALIAVVWASAALGSAKDRIPSIVRGVVELLSGVLLCYAVLSSVDSASMAVILAAVVSVVHLIVISGLIVFGTQKSVEKAKEEVQSTFTVEEYAEAYPYEGGPVAGVQMAEEVNPTFRPITPHVNTAGYDFYNSKSFDPFIATLDNEERNQFTEIFILKFKGTMPELPDYEVGGDNKEFFRKIFIYLGQYRDRIPAGLLSKIYQFSIKIS